jgi:hypothetical protein
MIRNFIGAESEDAAANLFQPPRAGDRRARARLLHVFLLPWAVQGWHVVCERFERDRVIGDARIGCAYWMRATGADD